MNKYQYLDALFTELQKYQIDSVEKHVNEYDYIIADMLEAGEDMDSVIKKLGLPSELATSIADEFEYQAKDQNQFAEPIISKNRSYSKDASKIVITIINIGFAIATAIYFISTLGTLALTAILLLAMPIYGFATGFLLFLTLAAATTFFISLYIIGLRIKRWLVVKLEDSSQPHNLKLLTPFIVTCIVFVLSIILGFSGLLLGGSSMISHWNDNEMFNQFGNNRMMNNYQDDFFNQDYQHFFSNYFE